jgi:hypothetical protein
MKAKYRILNKDMYSFDETGFMMGKISTGAVVTSAKRSRMTKDSTVGQSRVDNNDPGHQRNGVGNPTFIIFQGQTPPLCLVQEG